MNDDYIHDRFWSKVNKTEYCWEWIGAKTIDGYGQIGFKGAVRRATRVLWEIIYGENPGDLCVCHTCDNPSCVNPSHLFLATHQQNMQDRKRKGRNSCRKGQNNGRSKLTEKQILEIRSLNITNKEISKIYKISPGHVSNIKRIKGNLWAHIK